MGNDICTATANEQRAETIFAADPATELKHRPTHSKPEPSSHGDGGVSPLITTFRVIAQKYRANSRSKSASPQKKHANRKSPARPLADLQAVRKIASPPKKTANEVAHHVDGLLRKGRQSKLKLEIKRREKDLACIEERSRLQPNSHQQSSLKMDEFLRGQDFFQQRKKASLERRRQQQNNQLNESCTYQPAINVRSKRLVEERRSRETPIEKINRTEPNLASGEEACELRESSSPIKLRTIALDEAKPRKTLKLTRQRLNTLNSVASSRKLDRNFAGSSARSTQGHLASKLIKEFGAALQSIGCADRSKLSYLEFCEVFRMMGLIVRDSQCSNFVQAEERALLSYAYAIISEAIVPVECYSVLSLVLAVFGLDLYHHFSKVCLDSAKAAIAYSRSIEFSENSPVKPLTQFVSSSASKELADSSYNNREGRSSPRKPAEQYHSVPSAMKPDECEQTVASPMENLLVDSRLNRSLRELMRSRSRAERMGSRTKYFIRFSEDEIAEIQIRLKSFYNTKMSQAMNPPVLPKISVDRTSQHSHSRSSRKSLINTNELSAKHKIKVIDDAVRHSLVHPATRLNTVEVMHLQKLVNEKKKQQKKATAESKQLMECTFKPRTNHPMSGQDPPMRHLYLHEMGRDKVMYRFDREPEQDTEQCSFQPNLTLTRNFKPSTKLIKLNDSRKMPQSGDSQRKRTTRTTVEAAPRRILQIRVDLGSEEKAIFVDQGDSPHKLARAFLKDNGLPLALQERLAQIINDGISRAQPSFHF